MHGDRALVRIARIEPGGRADGEIVKVLKRAHPTVVGEFRVGRHGNYVVPQDGRIQQWIDIPEGMEIPAGVRQIDRIGAAPLQVSDPADLDGLIVDVELLEFPEEGGHAAGRVIEILGHPDDFGIDVEIVIRKHHLPHQFPPEVVEQAEQVPDSITASELEGRQDFRGLDIVTIDGETARDFDDAVWVDRLPNGNYALHVHIADVSHYVRPGSPIDVEARLRGTSVYFPDRAVPMLPFELSTNICSLKPQVDRLVLSALMEFDHQGDRVSQQFTPGVIRSAERMTYTNVHLLLEGDAALRARYAPLVARFELMQELALILNRKRVRRGSIDFDLPEPLIEFDEFGEMTGVIRAPRNIAHRLIEEFMLAANEAVASHLAATLEASIYRIHEPPDPKRVMEFEEVAAHFGYSLGVGAIPVKKFNYADHRRDGRKMRKEVVVAGKIGRHLVAELSAPGGQNRRQARRAYSELPDAAVAEAGALQHRQHRPLRPRRRFLYSLHFPHPALSGPDRASPADGCLTSRDPRRPSPSCAPSPRNARNPSGAPRMPSASWWSGRRSNSWSRTWATNSRAMAISATKYGLFVELEEMFIEGLVPIDMLPGDRYNYHENVRKIVGQRTRREFSIGDKLRVSLDRVDAAERKLQFSIVEPEPRRKRRERSRS